MLKERSIHTGYVLHKIVHCTSVCVSIYISGAMSQLSQKNIETRVNERR